MCWKFCSTNTTNIGILSISQWYTVSSTIIGTPSEYEQNRL